MLRRPALLTLLPVAAVLLLYAPAAFDASWIADDGPLLAHHLRPGDLWGEWTTPTHEHAADRAGGYLWRPLTSTVYQVVGETFGRTPTPFRLLNVFFHALNAFLVAAGARRFGASATGAALVATAWALHPLLPDAVCWMSDTYDLMAATLLLGGVLVAFADRGSEATRAAGTATLLFCACLCKESAIAFAGVMPAALLLLRGWRPAVAVGAACAAAALLHGAWHARVVGTFQTSALDLVVWSDLIGVWTDFLAWPVTMPVRAGFTHLVAPGDEPVSAVGVAILVGAVAFAAWAERRGERAGRHLLSAVGAHAVMLTPVALAALAFGQQSSRYLYMPMALAAVFLGGVRPAAPPSSPGRALAPALAALGLTAWWAPQSVTRITHWRSEGQLFLAEYAYEPDNAFAEKGLGRLLVQGGRTEDGLKLWAAALEHPPASSFVMDVQRERLDLTIAAAKAGELTLARETLSRFVEAEAEAGREVDPSVQRLAERLSISENMPD